MREHTKTMVGRQRSLDGWRSIARFVALASAASGALVSCAPSDGEDDAAGEEIVYAHDNRRDVYDFGGREFQQIARQSVAALMEHTDVDESDPQNVRFHSPTLGQAQRLCRTERFRSDPTAAYCSSTLIAPDLLLTAGHCFRDDEDDSSGSTDSAANATPPRTPEQVCADARIVFGYYRDSATTLHRITSDDVFRCAQIVARRLDADDANPNLDFAIIRLDRAATPRFAPAALDLSRSTLPRGTHLTVIGFGSGIPAKIQGNPKSMVRDPRTDSGDWFMASTDTFAGNSGSGVFDTQTHALIGILDRGNGDDYVANRGCNIVNVCRGNQCGDENEEVNYLRPIVDALCEAQPDTALCAERTWQ